MLRWRPTRAWAEPSHRDVRLSALTSGSRKRGLDSSHRARGRV